MPIPIKLLSIGHSYVVALNRRLVNEIARIGQSQWSVTAVAPAFMHGDLRPITLEADPNELSRLEAVPVYLSQRIHFMTYGWELKQILDQGWDLVHCWEEPYILPGGQVAWWIHSGVPLVYTTAQSYFKRYPLPFNWIEQYAMSRATGWICSGRTVAETLKPRQGYSLPMRLIPLGVDINHFYPSVDAKLKTLRSLGWEQQGSPIIGYLGRLVPEKGLDLLMRVLNTLQTPWRALFVGTGPMEAPLRAWAKRYPDSVRICTHVKHNEVPQYLNAMDVLCAPSQTMPNWREQFGRMLIEAFACGVPVIGSDSGEIPHVIQDAGVVVGEKDEQGWAIAISDLLNSPSRRQELASIGLHRAHTVYAWSVVARLHLEFLQNSWIMDQIRLAVICDYLEENWQSMDLCAQMLLKHLQAEHTASIQALQVCPTFCRRFQQVPWLGKKRTYNADRLLNRFWDYPHYLSQMVADFDFFHVADHTYAQLVHVLPPERTGVFCHDIDAFRSLLEPQEPRPSWYKAMSRRILSGLQKAAVVFYSTAEVRKQIEHYQLVEPSRLVHAPYGISSEFCIAPKYASIADQQILEQIGEAPFLLHVGSCIPRKRIDILLEVFAQVRTTHPEWRLVKVSGEWTQSQQQQITRLNIKKSIIHLQKLQRTTIAALYQRASAVLLTSEAEGFGLPVIEALACGAIVVASDIPVLREVGGTAAVYCPTEDVSAWVKTVEQLLANPSSVTVLNLLQAQAEKYSWSAHAQTIAQAYLRIAGG